MFGFHCLNAQEFELKITVKDSVNIPIINSIEFRRFLQTENLVYAEIDSISMRLQKIGFLTNYIDTTQVQDSIYTAHYILGDNSETITITYNDENINNSIKNLTEEYSNSYFKIDINDVSTVLNELVDYFENEGNSFVQVSLKNISQSENGLTADLNINKTVNRKIDGVIINGYSNFPKSFVKHYLNLKTETVFNTEKLKNASDAIQSLNFVSEIKSPEVLFTKDSTTVYLYLQKIKSNRFDGLIGFSTNENGKLKFNGYLDLLLNNVLNKGEVFSIKWQSNGEERKAFDLAIATPYIFNSPVSPKATFNIYKQDSTFINIKASVDVSYTINPQNSITAKFQTEKSNNLIEDNSQNNINEFNNVFYGISYTNKKLDPFRPHQNKFYFNINVLFGSRTLASEIQKTKQQKYELTANYIWALNQNNSIFIQNKSAIILSEDLYSNELYRIGGANSIRGFNEESIFASTFSILNLEYRYHLANLSYIYSITDFAYVKNEIQKVDAQLYGFGLGYVYSTKSGLIDISYALGKTSDIPFDFNNSRFHIKLVQFF